LLADELASLLLFGEKENETPFLPLLPEEALFLSCDKPRVSCSAGTAARVSVALRVMRIPAKWNEGFRFVARPPLLAGRRRRKKGGVILNLNIGDEKRFFFFSPQKNENESTDRPPNENRAGISTDRTVSRNSTLYGVHFPQAVFRVVPYLDTLSLFAKLMSGKSTPFVFLNPLRKRTRPPNRTSFV
jgi:hypothetical protein